MMKHAKFIVRFAVVAVVLALCVSGFWAVTQLKVARVNDNSTTSYLNFYKLPKDSADVIIIGSSHARDAFIPQELYDNYGITSYNLGCAYQPIIISYYWLKEALRYQHPKVVVLDAYKMFYSKSADRPEPDIRKTLDYMRWGKVKIEAINAVCENYEGHSKISYYLPNIRYHDRWKNLKEVNFLLDKVAAAGNFMGYPGGRTGTNNIKFLPLSKEKSEIGELEALDSCLEKLLKLCSENSVKLLLVKTPMAGQTIEKHAAVENFATEHKLPFYDMNEESIYNNVGIDFNADFVDYGHANMSGALKMTDYLGRLLSEKYGLKPHKSEPWEKTRKAYLNAKADYELKTTKKVYEYLSALKENADRYTALITVRGGELLQLGEESKAALKSLGLTLDLSEVSGKYYYAVISGGKVLFEKTSERGASHSGSLYDGRYVYVMSTPNREKDNCSIKINGGEKANRQGLNIVVFDDDSQLLISFVCFDVNTGTYVKDQLSDGELIRKISSARIDVKNEGADANDVEVLDMSDADAKIDSPKWMQNNGSGRVIQSIKGELTFKLKCKGDGQLSICLMGPDIRDDSNNKIPVWVQYSKLTVDGSVIIEGNKPAWHDKRQIFKTSVKDGQVLDVQVKWLMDYVAIGKDADGVIKEQEKLSKQVSELNNKLKGTINLAKVSQARIDVKNMGAGTDVEVMDISDTDAKIDSPKWMQNNGCGRVIQSRKGELTFKLKCKGDGQLSICLMGPDIRDDSNNKIPVWVQYSKLTVDGSVIFEGKRPAWHNKRQTFKTNVKDGQVLYVQVEWLPDYVAIGMGVDQTIKSSEKAMKDAKASEEKKNKQIKTLETELKEVKVEKDKAAAKLKKMSASSKKLKASNKKLKRELDGIRSKLWYKVLHRLGLIE